MTERITNNVWTFEIPLPDSPLKNINCYVLKGGAGERNLLVDTGFNRPECLEALLTGMKELELLPEDTDVFLTHMHSDHVGNASALQKLGCRIMLSKTDERVRQNSFWADGAARLLAEGMSRDALDVVMQSNPALLYAPGPFSAETVTDGDLLNYAGHTLECVATPGHTPGHMCLYDRENQIMLLGDHVLFDITPNICRWTDMDDALGTYINSLQKMLSYDIRIALPAHRSTGGTSVEERVMALLEHHRTRLTEVGDIIRTRPGLNGYDICGLMTWHIKSTSWEEFPPSQKIFAVGETLAHLDRLTVSGRIKRVVDTDGCVRYYP